MPADLQKARELFLHAVGKLPADEWTSYVAQACGGDSELQRQVEHLLQVHRQAGSFLERPAARLGDPTAIDTWPDAATTGQGPGEGPGTVIGPYKLMQQLGEGGMGKVYRCGDDVLGRDLALKVLRAELQGHEDAVERFLREARLTGSLQHPGIVPIHSLGRLADGRPFYTMKLVRGRTLDDLLHDQPAGPERLPRLLAIVEKVCQAVAYAHSKGVLHRDLKPSNVMVGKFGEVQVMDWGLAKVLSGEDSTVRTAAGEEEAGTLLYTSPASKSEAMSRTGAAMGTPSYMPPEQAMGERELVDERADVFALGAILCELLTGSPPYRAGHRDELLRRARRGDLAEALGRLERCGADGGLVALCRECLAADRLQRPRHAGVVAERLASYQAEVRERLRQSELERARTEVQAREERKRRRLRMELALAVLLLLLGVAAVWWQWQRRQAEADGAAAQVMADARRLNEEARADPLNAAGYDKAVQAAAKAGEVARAGGASETVKRQTDDLLAETRKEAEEAEKDRRLLVRLLEARGPREWPKYSRNDKGTMMAQPTVEELFASAFRDWGLDVDAVSAAEVAARLKARPPVVMTEVIAALDEWANQRRFDNKWDSAKRVAELAAALDAEPGSQRRELRDIMARNQLPIERALGMLSASLRPVPVPASVPWGRDCTRLRQLAEQIDPAVEPVLGLLTLTRALRVAGEEALAERLLRAALTARPREVVLYYTLGDLLTEQSPPRWSAAAECYAVARGLRPDLGVTLATALLRSGREREGLDLLAWLVKEQPDNPYPYISQAAALKERGNLDDAIASFHKALEIDPTIAPAHINLGNALLAKGQLDAAMVEFRQAIALGPKDAAAHYNLGTALHDKGRLDAAVAEYRQAIALDPKAALAHHGLGTALHAKGRLDEAVAEYRQAIALDPKAALAHHGLGYALHAKGRLDEAVAEYRQSITLDPKYALAHGAMGHALLHQGRYSAARESTRRALELLPADDPLRRMALQQLHRCDHMLALDQKLPAILMGEATPANPDEAVVLASMCQQPYKKRHAASARLYADAFTADPKLAADHRYNAACSAALAAAGEGEDARLLPDKVVTMFRRWALDWLREDLTAYAKLAAQNNPAVAQTIQQHLAHWRRDPDLASVRDHPALDHLADNERAAWQALWRDVDELAKRLAKKDEPAKGRTGPETPKAKP